MASVQPFRGLCPQAALAPRVACPPYDVVSTEEARALAAGDARSFLRVIRPEIDLPPGTDPHDPRVYEAGRAAFRQMCDEGVFSQDETPAYYIYRLAERGHAQTGILGCASAREYAEGLVRRHEYTRPDKEDDRMRHILTSGVQAEPVFYFYEARRDIDAFVAARSEGAPLFDFTAADGVRHTLWRVADGEDVARVRGFFGAVPLVYVADGHHRTAAAARVAAQRGETAGDGAAGIMALLFPHDQLRILEYNRLVRDLGGRTPDDLRRAIGARFTVTPEDAPVRPRVPGEFGMYLDGCWYRLRAPAPDPAAGPAAALDVSILTREILTPLLGIADLRRDPRIDFAGGDRGPQELQRRVDSGEMAVAFSLHPVGIGVLMAIADAGEVMPPKSTWFAPKPRSGLVVHALGA